MRSAVGAITSAVMKRARAVVTCGGGSDCVPMACRRSERTISILTKQVVMRMIDGARAITVRRSMMMRTVERPWGRSEVCGPWLIGAACPGTNCAALSIRSMGLRLNAPGCVGLTEAGLGRLAGSEAGTSNEDWPRAGAAHSVSSRAIAAM